MKKKLILYLLLFPLFSLYGLTFEEMAKGPITELEGEEVEIRGFLHRQNPSIWVLTKQPNVKSCCLGKSDKAKEQIFIHNSTYPFNNGQLVTLRGTLHLRMSRLELKDVTVIKENSSWFWSGLLLLGVILSIFLYSNNLKN